MSYRLIDANALTMSYAEVNDMPCIYADLPNGLDGGHYTMTDGGEECEMVTSGTPCEGNTDKQCTVCGAYNIGEYYDGQGHIAVPKFCPECGAKVKAVKR